MNANVLVYLIDADEPAKQLQARALMAHLAADESETVLLWQAAVEFLACLHRWESRGRIDRSQLSSYWQQIESMLPIIPPTAPVIDRALELWSSHSLSHWNSLLLSACIEAGATTLYSEDLSHGVTYDTVTVLNPFMPL